MTRDKFTMPWSVAEILFKIEDKTAQLRMINAILKYEFEGILPKFQGEELVLFNQLISEIKDFEKGVRND